MTLSLRCQAQERLPVLGLSPGVVNTRLGPYLLYWELNSLGGGKASRLGHTGALGLGNG